MKTKTAKYRETYRKHRVLLSLPIVLAALIAGWTAFGSSKTYVSSASLWVDNPATTASSLGNLNPAVLPPSQEEEQVVTELLATNDFVDAVARRSGLADYLAKHSSTGFGPSALFSGGGGPLDIRIASALSPSSVITSVPGPQVLKLTYTGPTPELAQRTLQAIMTQLQQDNAQFTAQHSEGELSYYKAQAKAASQALVTARDQLQAYTHAHPGVASGDPTLAALQTAQSAAEAQLTQANNAASGANAGGAAGSAVHVIDPASTPTGPTSGKKKQLLAIVGGLFAGLLVSFLGAVALTPSKPLRWEDEENVPANLGLFAPTGDLAVPVVQNHARTQNFSSPLVTRRFVAGRRFVGGTSVSGSGGEQP